MDSTAIECASKAANDCSVTAAIASLMTAVWLLRTEMERQRAVGGERGEGGGGHLARLQVVVSRWESLRQSDWMRAALSTEAAAYRADELGTLSCHHITLVLHQRIRKAWDVARQEAREEAESKERGVAAVQGRQS